jgi:uncharacterized protein with PQ loop repeat
MINLLGLTGSTLLAFCALPEVFSSIRKGYCGSSLGLLIVWFIGEILTFAYVFITNPDVFLLLNYGTNVILILVLLYYKSKPVRPQAIRTISFIGQKESPWKKQ